MLHHKRTTSFERIVCKQLDVVLTADDTGVAITEYDGLSRTDEE